MQNVQAPEQVQAAFDDAFKAGPTASAKNEGQAYANDVIPKAQGTAARLREEAEGYKARVVAQAEGDAQRFRQVLAEYQKAPAVTRDRLYLDAMQQVYGNVTKVLVDSRSNSTCSTCRSTSSCSRPPRARRRCPRRTTRQPCRPAPSPPASPADSRSRDGLRSRDRDVR